MKFYVIEVTSYNNGTNDSYGVYPYPTLDQAEAVWHQKLAGARNNSTYAKEMCMVIDGEGQQYRREFWERQPVFEPETED